MTNKDFIRTRAKAVALDARMKPETCKVARNWLERAYKWASNHDMVLAHEIKELERGIV